MAVDKQEGMNEAQDAAFAHINGSWPIARYNIEPNGCVSFICDDGDTGWIDEEGEWGWDN